MNVVPANSNFPATGESRPHRTGILLCPGFSLFDYSAVVEILGLANAVTDIRRFEYPVFTLDGQPVHAGGSVAIDPEGTLTDKIPLNSLIILAGIPRGASIDVGLLRKLRLIASRGVHIGAIGGGVFYLAAAQLLGDRSCSVPAPVAHIFRELHPNVELSASLFEVCRGRFTGAGGLSTIDLMLGLIQPQLGSVAVCEIARELQLSRIRTQMETQVETLTGIYSIKSPVIRGAFEYIRRPHERRISVTEVAGHLGISARQLERAFRKHVGKSPAKFIRLEMLRRGRHLVRHTTMSIIDVAISCGFNTSCYFARAYREAFGCTPSEDRI